MTFKLIKRQQQKNYVATIIEKKCLNDKGKLSQYRKLYRNKGFLCHNIKPEEGRKLCRDIEHPCRDITRSRKKKVYRDIENSIATEAIMELEFMSRHLFKVANQTMSRHFQTMSRHNSKLLVAMLRQRHNRAYDKRRRCNVEHRLTMSQQRLLCRDIEK